MTDYDFSSINDKLFEQLSAALLSRQLSVHIEQFKPGKDQGIDGRFFSADDGLTIVQCKHWRKSGFTKLRSHLKKTELSKIQKLNPDRYILTTSVALSPPNKADLINVLSPYVKSSSDIYGADDLNPLLLEHDDIHKKFPQLWMAGTTMMLELLNNAVGGRSKWREDQVRERICLYVQTATHLEARELLAKNRVLILTGEPGAGKTTLADQLCLEMVSEEYQLVSISEDVAEGESVFDDNLSQIFLFDDFLGRNFLDALRHNEDSRVVSFMLRVRKQKNKRFILTSRTSIMNQGRGLSDEFEINHVKKNEFELQVSELTDLEKATILYNHIWFSDTPDVYSYELRTRHRYMRIVRHRNFNPRLIQFITDPERFSDVEPNKYWATVESWLENPAEIWKRPFSYQISAEGRLLVMLVAFNRRPISEVELRRSFDKLCQTLPQYRLSAKATDFIGEVECLGGAFLTRTQDAKTLKIVYDLFTPAIGDYVLGKYCDDPDLVREIFLSLRTADSLLALKALSSSRKRLSGAGSAGKPIYIEDPAPISPSVLAGVLVDLSDRLSSASMPEILHEYREALSLMIIGDEDARGASKDLLEEFYVSVLSGTSKMETDELFELLGLSISHGIGVSRRPELGEFILNNPPVFQDIRSVEAFFKFFAMLTAQEKDLIESTIEDAVFDCWNDNVYDFVSGHGILDDYDDYDDTSEAEEVVSQTILSRLSAYPIDIGYRIDELCEEVDVHEIIEQNRQAAKESHSSKSPPVIAEEAEEAAIHDMFQHSTYGIWESGDMGVSP